MAIIKPALIVHSSRQIDPNVILDSDLSKYVLKIPDIPDYQNFVKNRLGHQPDTTITGALGEDDLKDIIFDGTFLWIGLGTSPAKILKLNPSDNSYSIITADEGGLRTLAFDSRGLFIWAGLDTSPAKILKINSSTNIIENTITAETDQNSVRALIHDGTYIWAGLNTSPAIFLKINPITDTIDNVITVGEGEDYCRTLTFDGIFLWAGLYTDPAKILKINPTTDSNIVSVAKSYNATTAAYTDETTDINNATANDVALPPIGALNDAIYIGHTTKKFDAIHITVGTAGVYSATLQWQYWNGTVWAALSGVTDGTSGFTVAGTNNVTFTMPTDWATTTVDTVSAYYIRCIVTAFTSVTTAPLGTKAWLNITTITAPAGQKRCEAITFDGTFIWARVTLGAFLGGRLLKINPATNTIEENISGFPDFINDMVFDGSFIWIAGEFATD